VCHVIEPIQGARKVLNQPKKHPRNPLMVRDQPWEGYAIAHGSVVHDPGDGLFKLWYSVWRPGRSA
jgi:hypothetical protein